MLVDGTRILILSDEVYEHIIFDGLRHESCARHDALARRAFIVGSFGKTYHTTGWKVGYTVAPAALTTEFRKVHQFVTFSTNTPVQHAIADFLETRRGLDALGPFFQAKRDLFLRLMQGSRFRPLACRGSYFQLMDYSAITDEPDADFAIRLTKERGVASIPTSPFLHVQKAPKVLRFCFAKRDETLEQAARTSAGRLSPWGQSVRFRSPGVRHAGRRCGERSEIRARTLGSDPPRGTLPRHMAELDLWSMLFVFMLATFVGFQVIQNVSRLLHTPLMSLTNAISAIAIVGAILVAGEEESTATTILGAVAVAASMTNIVSGFLITDRMLKMFRERERKP